jgi:hypothetical protein
MNRRLGLAVLVIAMLVAACGRQVTGLNQPSGIPAGKMLIRVSVAGVLDFTNYKYVIVFNTSGNGNEPYSNAYQSGFLNYSYALIFAGPTGLVSSQLLQYYLLPGTTSGLGTYNIIIPVQSLNFVQNDNGKGNEFQVTFNRLLLDQPSPTGGSATSAPGASPTPSPGSSATPVELPTTAAQESWNINFIVTDQNGVPVDSMGIAGAQDVSFNLSVNTTQAINTTYTKPIGSTVPSSTNAQLTGYTIINSP